jgi:hypothetical protein
MSIASPRLLSPNTEVLSDDIGVPPTKQKIGARSTTRITLMQRDRGFQGLQHYPSCLILPIDESLYEVLWSDRDLNDGVLLGENLKGFY